MHPINELSLTAACLCTGLIQASVSAAFALKIRTRVRQWNRRAPGPALPCASVLVPCKGPLSTMKDNLRSLLDQRYCGTVQFLFVTPTENDPATGVVRELLREVGRPGARLLITDLKPRTSSAKIVSLLYGVDAADPNTEVFAFADADIRVPPHWLEALVLGLWRNPGVAATTTHALYVPRSGRLSEFAKLSLSALSMTGMAFERLLVGWSWAIRKRDFEAFGIREIWARSYFDDVVLNRVFACNRGSLRWVPEAGVGFWDDSGWDRVFEEAKRAFFNLRVCDAGVWLLATLAVGWVVYLIYWALVPPLNWRLLLVTLLVFSTNPLIAVGAVAWWLPHTFGSWRVGCLNALASVAAFPAVLGVLAYAAALSPWSREVVWSGTRYRVLGPERVEVVSTEEDA